mgnify:CR=1 FL=1
MAKDNKPKEKVKNEGKKLSALYTISGDKIERKNRKKNNTSVKTNEKNNGTEVRRSEN